VPDFHASVQTVSRWRLARALPSAFKVRQINPVRPLFAELVAGQHGLPVHKAGSASTDHHQQHCPRLPLKLTLPMPPTSRAAKFNKVYPTPFTDGTLRQHRCGVR
jgi:hypothetical protein